MTSKFRAADREPLVRCSCRYCKGKKVVSRYVRRQHSQRYQYEVRAPKSVNVQGQCYTKSPEVQQEVSCCSNTTSNDVREDVSLDLLSNDMVIHMDDEDHDKALGKLNIDT